jgi:hypothetical protein
MVKPIHSGSNPRFDMNVAYLQLIILSVVGDILIDNKTLFNRLCGS